MSNRALFLLFSSHRLALQLPTIPTVRFLSSNSDAEKLYSFLRPSVFSLIRQSPENLPTRNPDASPPVRSQTHRRISPSGRAARISRVTVLTKLGKRSNPSQQNPVFQETEFLKSGTSVGQISGLLTIPPPKKLVPPSENGMLPPPPKFMPAPPPPKFTPPPRKPEVAQSNGTTLKERPSSDILQKLADYGDNDDNDEDVEESHKCDLRPTLSAKPFWAVRV